MANDKSCYDKNIDDVASKYNISPKTVISWINNGYPLPNGKKIQLEGFLRVGRNLRFNINTIDNFIFRVNNTHNEKWEYSNALIKQKRVLKPAKIGTVNSILMVSDSAKRLELRLNGKQKKDVFSSRRI